MLLLIYFHKHESGHVLSLSVCITTINSDSILI